MPNGGLRRASKLSRDLESGLCASNPPYATNLISPRSCILVHEDVTGTGPSADGDGGLMNGHFQPRSQGILDFLPRFDADLAE